MSHATGWRQQERELRVCDFRLRGAALKIFSPFVCARNTNEKCHHSAHKTHDPSLYHGQGTQQQHI